MQAKPLTLHIRLTKQCNADCSYCSSYQESPDSRLKPDDLKRILNFVLDTAPKALGVAHTHITAQFLGGEIALVPPMEMQAHIDAVKTVCESRGLSCVVGGQSNLIASQRRVDQLYQQFEGRLGTSIDLTSNVRTVQGDADKYRLIWKSNDDFLRKRRSTAGAVYVLEPSSLEDAKTHLWEAARARRIITYRPVFQGGMEGVELNKAEDLEAAMCSLFDDWFMRMPVIAEPFFQMTTARLGELSKSKYSDVSCAFQSDCTQKSLNIEPNGDLYVCLEMADAGLRPIGNALRKEWDVDALMYYSSRQSNLDPSCLACPYLKSCQGGCMFEAIAQGKGADGKSSNCVSWKAIFNRIDQGVAEYGIDAINEWILRISERHENARNSGILAAFNDTLGEEE